MTRADRDEAMASERAQRPESCPRPRLMIGLDVGSTAVKAVVVAPGSGRIVWKRYVRHGTRQVETCLEFLEALEQDFSSYAANAFRVFVTGTGGEAVAQAIGGLFVQEVNAVALAVERLHPDARSIIELGGQDAKIIFIERDEKSGKVRKIPSMNDKCAGGTGSVIDKIAAKLEIDQARLRTMDFDNVRIHPIAGKCGVFAETDINSLQKQGVPAEELIASLFDSIVQQNLSVLTRGSTLKPIVVLLGGPNRFLPGLQQCWRRALTDLWTERKVVVPPDASQADTVRVPEDAEFYGALGAVFFGEAELQSAPSVGIYRGSPVLRDYLNDGRRTARRASALPGLVESDAERDHFLHLHHRQVWQPVSSEAGSVVRAFVGLDGGSTSTKAVLIDRDRNVIAKAYQLSKGNPIEDTKAMFASLRKQIEEQGCQLEILGVATTGYAKDMLKDVLRADVALVETVAHTQSGLHYYPHADVVCDVGGQDIKIIMLKNGVVKDFKLNSQCSAGNGYYLQATAEAFGYDVRDYASTAFTAKQMPRFGYGCAVFLQSDIVDFQRQGWKPNEILAGLAAVLPKNIWLYVCKMPNLARLGKTFILQGGTQHNLAAVKAQVDYIESKFLGTGVTPEIVVHEHCGEAGAIGCAFEAHRMCVEEGHRTEFIGLDAVAALTYSTDRDDSTRCAYCRNRCLRTFIDIDTPHQGHRRLIIAPCEKGSCEDINAVRTLNRNTRGVADENPDLAAAAARSAFVPVDVPLISRGGGLGRSLLVRLSGRRHKIGQRSDIRIGMPRILNFYDLGPFFMGFFQSLGICPENLVWSDYTSERLYKAGAKRGSVDPCYPSKVAIPHVHNLLVEKHRAEPLDYIFAPMIDSMPTFLKGVHSSRSCPTSAATPEAIAAAFTKEQDLFAEAGVGYMKTFLNLDDVGLCAKQLHSDWAGPLGLGRREAVRAVYAGLDALARHDAALRLQGREVIERLERERRLGIVLLARPYHSDPGICHEITGALQQLGYPILTHTSLPTDGETLRRVFGAHDDAEALSIGDVWPHSYNENGNRKLWAAKFAARHPNLVALELSSFKCGHDAPIYTLVEDIVEHNGTPFFYFKDLDENKPVGSIKIRLETMAYFLERYREQIMGDTVMRRAISERLASCEASSLEADPAESAVA